jgi:hypothetical protein
MNRISKNEALLSLVTAASLLMASCHDARRSNPVDPAGIVDVDIAVSAVEDSTATIAWTPYTGDVEFSHYLVLRRTDELGATADTVEVLDDRWVIHVSRPDTIARIEDLSVTSYTDTVIPNIPFTYQVSVINAGGLESTSVESAPVLTVAPRISFYTNRDGNGEVYVMNEDGRALANLTNHSGIDGQVVNSVEGRPAWSPDGSRIAFVSSRDGNAEIYVMMADGSDPTNMTNDPGYDSFPKWSPDGGESRLHRIAVAAGKFGSWLQMVPTCAS